MPRYQLALAVTLLVTALISAVVIYLYQPATGKIALYHDDDEALEPELAGEKDPFDVTKPEDIVDGTPLNEEAFWQQMRLRKIAVVAILALNFVLLAIAFGWSLAAGEVSRNDVLALGFRLSFALYLFGLALRWVNQSTVDEHWPTTVHLSALTATEAFLLTVTAILPDTPSPATMILYFLGHEYPGALKGLWYASYALVLVTFAICSTVPRGPLLHFPSDQIYSEKTLATSTTHVPDNVCGLPSGSVWDVLLFSYTTKVVWLGYTAESLEIGDLPIVPSDMRSTTIYLNIRNALKRIKLPGNWRPAVGSGWTLLYRLMVVNAGMLVLEFVLAAVSAVLFYSPAFFLQRLVRFMEVTKAGDDRSWGWFYCGGLFASNAITYLITGQLWSISTTTLQARMRAQMNTLLFAKTLVRKDVASSAGSSGSASNTRPGTPTSPTSPTSPTADTQAKDDKDKDKDKKDEDDFHSKQQVMTLMTTDVDRVGQLAWYLFPLVDSPIELAIGTLFLYKMLGSSAFVGLAVTCLFLPVNHYASKVVVDAQDNLMKTRDERVALMNEILGGIRMLKFMAWERNFEKRVMLVRDKELKYQRLNYIIETAFNAIWNGSPLFVTLVSFWHYAVWRGVPLTPSVAFTSISVFNEMRFALNALPETFINILQSLVSARRIEKYMNLAEVSPVPPLGEQELAIVLNSATLTWPQERGGSATPSVASTPAKKFVLLDLNLRFPVGELSLICGKLGSGKTLLLQALLGEADVLAGQLLCPRSPPDFIASFGGAGAIVSESEWIVPGVCAYVPQVSWLQNATIRENILFHLPYNEVRYQRTLEACALVADMKILEDGDQSEIGERGVNLSGGQKARVSLARAVYSRASILLLDDVLSAVDAHTADHLFEQCIKGDIMKGRTVILVSHHVQLCTNGASYVVALDNGRLAYEGPCSEFVGSAIMTGLVQSANVPGPGEDNEKPEEDNVEVLAEEAAAHDADSAEGSDTAVQPSEPDAAAVAPPKERRAPRKFIEEEKRAVGRIGNAVWKTYILACGGKGFWTLFLASMVLAALVPVFENGWIRVWSNSVQNGSKRTPGWYISVYASITVSGLLLTTWRWFVLYYGSLEASRVLYQRLLERVLFANIRFHDTINRGRLLNRFGKDFEGIDSSLSDNFGRSIINALSVTTTLCSVTYVGGLPFGVAAGLIGTIYWNVARIYGQTSRDMRRLDSVTRSPLYSIYGETISGVAVIRAFGAGSKFLRDMLRCVDTNMNPYFWMWSVNRWLSARFNLLSSVVVGITGVTTMLTPGVDAALAGFALAFASTITGDLLFLVRRFVGLEQSMVAVERVKEFSEIEQEPPEFIYPRPAKSWPAEGAIAVQDLSIRYAADLPNVLHSLNFEIYPGEKVGVLGRTGSGKSTLALSFFRFVEPSEGRILIDGVDISSIGLTDLRSRLTIIPQDPTILSGTLRSTLDVFEEYQDAEIFEALRRVHLIPAEDTPEEEAGTINANVFRNLDSPVSEGGENFSAGEKQLICMARAILKRTKVLLMDEATASVDYATDELISKTIREEFAESTIITIAHRLRTVVDYSRVMLLENGRVVEFDRPAALLSDPTSKFYGLCKAAGKEEFQVLKRMAGAA